MTVGSTQLNPHARDAAHVLGCRIDRLDMEMTLHRIEDVIKRREYVQHVAINAAKLVACGTMRTCGVSSGIVVGQRGRTGGGVGPASARDPLPGEGRGREPTPQPRGVSPEAR